MRMHTHVHMHKQVGLPSRELREVFTALDEDASGAISYKELCHVVFPDLEV